jgi:hypothetical protein
MKQILQNVLLLLALFTVMSCKKATQEPEATLNQKDISLHYNETFTFEVKKGNNVIDFSTLTTSSSDEFVGTINNQGVFEANTIGETTIKIMGDGVNLTAKVTVTPIQNLFEEPITNFLFNKSQIKSAEKRNLLNETATGLLYDGENNLLEYVIYILTNQGYLSSSAMLFPLNSTLPERLAVFYAERYNIIGELDNYFYFANPRENYFVRIGMDEDLGLHALYIKDPDAIAEIKSSTLEKVIVYTPQNKTEFLQVFRQLKENERADY